MKFKLASTALLGAIILALASCANNETSTPSTTPSVDVPSVDKTPENPSDDSKPSTTPSIDVPSVDNSTPAPSEGKPTENKPTPTPTKKPDVVIPEDVMVDGKGIINIKPVRHEYLKSDVVDIYLNINVDNSIIKNSKVSYKLTSNSSLITKGEAKGDKDGNVNIKITLDDFNINNGRYLLELNSLSTTTQIPSYFSFDVVDSINSEVVDYNSLKAKGSFDNVMNKSPYTEAFIKANALRGLGGFNITSLNDKMVSIDSLASARPTILIFSTIGCASCKAGMKYLSMLDTNDLNLVFITAGISSEEIAYAKSEAKEKAALYGISEDSLYFDTVDGIWNEVLSYTSAPQMVFLNSYSEPIGFMTSTGDNYNSYNAFKDELNSVLKKSYNIILNDKIEYVDVTVHYMDSTNVISVKKNDTITIDVPVVDNYRFMGYLINDEYIDLEIYKFTESTDIYLDYKLAGVKLDDIKEIDSVLIDLRTEAEFNKGHLDNAILVSRKDFTNSFLDKRIDKNKTIILYGLDKPYEIMDYLESIGYKSFYLIDYVIKDNEETKYLTYEDRLKNNEIDHYFDAHLESEVLKEHYGKSYLDLSFTGFDKASHTLNDYIYLENKPTIIMVGSTTCVTCEYTFDRFIEMEANRTYNFVEAISFSKKEDLNTLIDKQLERIDKNVLDMHKKYRFFDNNRYSKDNERFLGAHELPIFYILDRMGNLTNVVSSFNKALKYVDYLGNSVSIRSEEESPNREMIDRINNMEFKHIESNEILYGLLQKSYAKFLLKESYFDFTHTIKNINSFMDYNGFDKKKPLVLYVMNSHNSDFDESIRLLDSMMLKPDSNLLAVVDNNSVRQTNLIMKPYSSKIMFDDYNTNVSNDLVLYKESYFVILDSEGNLTNIVLDYKDLDKTYKSVVDTISVKSANSLTKPSVIKPGDNVLSKDEAFTNKGFISHLDSVKDMARYEYLNINYGRNYLDFNVIDSTGSNVTLGSLIDSTKETIVCFLQSYMDDFYYAFNPLYKLKDRCNIIIVFTNRKDEPYNNEFVDNILRLGQKKAVAKAKEPQNIGGIQDIVKSQNPGLSGEALDKAVDEYLLNKYDYLKMKDFIYGSYAYLTTPLLETEVRGIQLYLDKNGNLSSISQTYYAVGGVFETVLNKIEGYIAKED